MPETPKRSRCSIARQGTGKNKLLSNRECVIYIQPNPILTKMRSWQFESWGGKKGKGEKSEVCVNQKHKRWTIRGVVVCESCDKDFSEQLRICRRWKETHLKMLQMRERKRRKKKGRREENKREEIHYTRNILYFHVVHVVTRKGLQALFSWHFSPPLNSLLTAVFFFCSIWPWAGRKIWTMLILKWDFPSCSFCWVLNSGCLTFKCFQWVFCFCGLVFLSRDSSLKKPVCGHLAAVKQKVGVGHRHMSSEQIQ